MTATTRDNDGITARYKALVAEVAALQRQSSLTASSVQLVAVTKRQPEHRVEALLAAGHRLFGENQVQEAQSRWLHRRQDWPDIVLHMIGSLQTNKAKEAVALFDVIETLDRPRLAAALDRAAQAAGKIQRCFIQVNIGEEPQKSGIAPAELAAFYRHCLDYPHLSIDGLMCIPPADDAPEPFFALMRNWQDRLSLPYLSMGMSGDYPAAIRFGATHIRIGTALLGERLA